MELLKNTQAQADIAANLHALKMEWTANKVEQRANQCSSAPEIYKSSSNLPSSESIIPVASAPTTVPACADSVADSTDTRIVLAPPPVMGSSEGALDRFGSGEKPTGGAQQFSEGIDSNSGEQFLCCKEVALESCIRQPPPGDMSSVDTTGSFNSRNRNIESRHADREPVYIISKPPAAGVPHFPRTPLVKFSRRSGATSTTIRGDTEQKLQPPSGDCTGGRITGYCAVKACDSKEGIKGGLACNNGGQNTFSSNEGNEGEVEGKNDSNDIQLGSNYRVEGGEAASGAARCNGIRDSDTGCCSDTN